MNENLRSAPHSTPHWADIGTLYGPLPPIEDGLRVRLIHRLARPTHTLSLWRVIMDEPLGLQWTLGVAQPIGVAAHTVLLTPDGCWPDMVHGPALTEVLDQGLALAWFDRLDLAWDGPDRARAGPLHDRWPNTPWSAVAAWAWGVCRSTEVLRFLIDRPYRHVGVVGHSRGGKAVLIAGAVDSNIAAVVAHNSGTGGAASLQSAFASAGAESLAQLAEQFPHWLSPDMVNPAVQADLIAQDAPSEWIRAIAPRGLCVLQASDDAWANPDGTQHMVRQVAEAWRDHPERLVLQHRTGGHAMTALDWQRAAEFVRGAVA